MTQSESKLVMEIEPLMFDFENSTEKIATLLKGKIINATLGTQLIYSDKTRNCRMLMFVIMLNESSNLKTDWVTAYNLLKEAYIMTDNIYAQVQKSPYPFDLSDYLLEMKQHVNTDEQMHPEELAYLNSLQFPLTVYRGMCNKEFEDGRFGVSWSDSEKTASRYVFYSKNNNNDSNGKIVVCTIERSDIFAVWGVNGKEKEIIIPKCTRH